MITVMGANGHTGQAVVEELLRRGEKVRALGRSKEKLAPFAKQGAEIAIADATDAKALTEAFRGSESVYTLIPPNFAAPDFRKYQEQVGDATIKAIKDSGVKRVVVLSSIGADKPSGTGPIAGIHVQEEKLKKLGVHTLSLRAAYFFENFFMNLGMIKHQGINGSAVRGDVPMAMIATRDIGVAAARALAERKFTGFSTRELQGPRDYTMNEATTILGKRIGKPDLKYVTFSYEDAEKGMTGAGLTPDMARLYVEMMRAFNEGHAKMLEKRSPETTTPTRFEDFAEVLAGAYAQT